ncbi:MAG TPA: DUF2169 domain-containing protein, partial [Armatimonadota bacterium]|nr:DUF2169 domain-containing protein [Armatimonadota bacterium]
MDVVSTCPIRVSSVTWQPWPGVWAFTVVCKATFRLEPGTAQLAEAQEAPTEVDAPWENDASKSLYAPTDLVPFKARADVLLVGHAFAPRRQPSRSLMARLAVGEIDKRVEVWCDRIFWGQGQVLEGSPFVRMDLRYERAAGGPENPVGMRFDAPPDGRGAIPIPNLQPPGVRELRLGVGFPPVGFGPIAPSWPERGAKLPKGAAGWSPRGWREQAL